MRRALVVAGAEFRAFVRTKSYAIGLVLPLVMGALGGLAAYGSRPATPRPSAPPPVALIDHSGMLAGPIELAAGRHAAALERWGFGGTPLRIERVAASPAAADELAALGRRVRSGELLALVEVPAEAAQPSASAVRLRVVAQARAGREISEWLERVVRDELRARAVRSAELPAELRARLEREVVAEIAEPPPAPGEATAVAPDPAQAPAPLRRQLERLAQQKIAITGPLGFVVFFVVTLAAAPLFQGVLDEKSTRVSEILLSSISPFELMLGKLLGGLAASGIAALLYAAGLLALLVLGFGAALPGGLFALAIAYLVLSSLLWGAIFLAIGAACADARDAQNLMLPAVLAQILPVVFATNVLSAPSGALARFLSLFPPSAPLATLLRLGFDPAPAAAEIALSLALLAASAVACVWAAGRVLRVGLLLQGRSATLREIAHWVRTG
jgi:ABC-2 type transport system permease protein